MSERDLLIGKHAAVDNINRLDDRFAGTSDAELIEQLRHVVKDRTDAYDQQRSFRAKLFPLSRGDRLTLMDILYAEALWAAMGLTVAFLVFAVATAGLQAATAFALMVVLYMLPVLLLWPLVGVYYIRKNRGQYWAKLAAVAPSNIAGAASGFVRARRPSRCDN